MEEEQEDFLEEVRKMELRMRTDPGLVRSIGALRGMCLDMGLKGRMWKSYSGGHGSVGRSGAALLVAARIAG